MKWKGGKNSINKHSYIKFSIFIYFLFYEYVYSVCMYVGLPSACLVPIEVRRRY